MPYENYQLIDIEVRNKVAYATINNPPINVITPPLLREFVRLSEELDADPDLLVVVLRSANPISLSPTSTSAQFCSSPSTSRHGTRITPTPSTMICASAFA